MIPNEWRNGEVAVVGLGRSGVAAARLLATQGFSVYASDTRSDEKTLSGSRILSDYESVSVDTGGHDLERIKNAVVVVTSPGVPPTAPPLAAAADAGVRIFAEIDMAARALDNARFIVVTGTNGKSTTTALIAHLLNESGVRSVAAGNIGHPLSTVASETNVPDWIVLEASSYQLHFAPNLKPEVGVVTNLSPDHLDWYKTAEAYYADKQKLFRNATNNSIWVLNGDDSKVLELAAGVVGTIRQWSMCETRDAWYRESDDMLLLNGSDLLARDRFLLLGDHNISNALAASLAASTVTANDAALSRGLESFEALRHRLESVRELSGVEWINDSKATNVGSAEVAIKSMVKPFVILLGGRPKGEDYTRLAPLLVKKCHDVVCYGEGAQSMMDALSGLLPVHPVPLFDDAVREAQSMSRVNGAVLLSPACASFDQFDNFEERGDRFRELVEAL